MSSNPNNYLDGTLVGIVVGGDINDPAPDQSCNMKVFIPGLHGKDVKIEHLAFSSMMKSPTKSSQDTFEGVLDPGSLVFVRKDTGSPICHIIGTANDIYNPDSRTPGNIDLVHSIPFIADIMRRTIDVRIPPQIIETVVGGAKVKTIREKGRLHSHNLTAGLPSNAALYNLSGTILPQVTGVTTAVQSAANILDSAVAAVLPGSPFSLGNLLSNLPSDLMNVLASALPPGLMAAFNNMNLLMQSIESTGASFSLAAKCDPIVFMNNAVSLLSQATNLSDMISAMQRLQTDTSLYGLENLPFTSLVQNTPFGNVLQRIGPTGDVLGFTPPNVAQAINTAMNLMTSATAFPGVNIGQNFFGAGAKTMMDMVGRLPSAQMGEALNMLNTLNTSGPAQTIAKFVKDTAGGGNPFKNFRS